LTIHEDNDWQDEERFERQTAELENYRRATIDYHRTIGEQENVREALQHPQNLSLESRMDQEDTLGGMLISPPPPPSLPWMKDPEDPLERPAPIKKVPAHMFSHGVCMESITGDKGLGFGRIEASYNKAANVITSQFVDAMTLANCSEKWVSDILEIERPHGMVPGGVVKVGGVSGDELHKSVMDMRTPPANPQMLDVVNILYEYAESAVQAPGALSGEAGKSGETWRGLSTRVEQAIKPLSVWAGNYADFLTQILKNNAYLNWVYGDDEEIIMVNNHRMNSVQELRISRDMYRRNYNVAYRSDLKFTGEAARIQEADQIVSMGMMGPLQADIPFMYEAVKEALVARGKESMVPSLGPRPEPPSTTFGIPQPPPGAPPEAPPEGGEEEAV